MSVPHEITDLIERFDRNAEDYRSGRYNETQLRRDFIDPFFEALGWDINNRQGLSERFRHVIHEDAIKIGGHTKAPDYGFYVGETRMFFVEAKKPSVNIKHDVAAAFQLRRYGWSAKLPLSILTSFDEFAVYDCRSLKPVNTDRASTARLMYFGYQEYAERWDEITSIFSRDAVQKGAFDKYAAQTKGRRGTAEVDDAFLEEIESWRKALASNIYLRNPHLTTRELNFAVGIIIDRIIFLRICEDRGIEPDEQLKRLINSKNIYQQLLGIFYRADQKYNSGLFHFDQEKGRAESPDTLTPSLAIDDKVLKEIFKNIYLPLSPYEFSVLPADILGQVYEQFLGKVIHLTAHRAVVEDKPEVRKAGGVYYTPSYIVDYIVKHTVGKLCEDKTAKQVDKLRILDPACGSGSFLIAAYQYLLDWYLDWYVKDGAEKHHKQLTQGARGEWRLATAEKRRILLQNIYGVDIDSQAVEVTKLSLLLKVLEGETEQSLARQMRLLHERVLPDLGSNIKCGNSLIEPDLYDDPEMSKLGEEEHYLINVFDWEKEFSEIMRMGGFDAVIGNPPYIRSQSLGAPQREYYNRKYQTATRTYDIYVLFVERAISLINKSGRAGFILPNKFFTTDYGEGLRRILGSSRLIETLVDFEDAQVFSKAGTYTTLLFLSRAGTESPEYVRLGDIYRTDGSVGLANALTSSNLSFAPITLTDDGSRWTLAAGQSGELLIRLQQAYPVFASLNPHIFQGLKTSADKIYMLWLERSNREVCVAENGYGEHLSIELNILKPVVKGEHVHRYLIDQSAGLFIIYPYNVDSKGRATLMTQEEIADKYPKAWEYLNAHRKSLSARDAGKWGNRHDWYAYARGQNIGTFLGSKFLAPYMTTRLRSAFDEDGNLFFVNITTGGYGLRVDIELHSVLYLLALINSSLLNYCIRQMTNRFQGGYFAVNKQALERLPIRLINFSDSADKARHDRMVERVERMLDLQKQLANARTDQERTIIQRRIDTTDAQIDALVYELYGLTEDEIKIVEASTQ